MTCSGDQKVTTMILKVDLQCCKCYKKIKKILCKFPQIRDQVYDEKQNTVTITVVCCSPEKIMDKLCCKGRKTIKCIEIKAPPATKPKPDKPKPKPAPAPTEPEKPKPKSAPVPAPVPVERPPQINTNGPKNGSKSQPAPKPVEQPPVPKPAPKPVAPAPAPASKPAQPAPAPAPTPALVPVPYPVPQWIPSYPPCGPPPQVSPCCTSCYEGRPGGPCYQGGYGPCLGYWHQYGRPICPPGYYPSRCYYICEENPSSCSIM